MATNGDTPYDLSARTLLRLGDWRLDSATGELWSAAERAPGKRIRLEPKLLAVLLLLTEEPGRVISKDRLLSEVWSETFVADDVVWRSISELRRLLDDRPKEPRYIETLPRRGYRWIASVGAVSAAQPPSPRAATFAPLPKLPPTSSPAKGYLTGGSWLRAALAAILLSPLLLIEAASRPAPRPLPTVAARPLPHPTSAQAVALYQQGYPLYRSYDPPSVLRGIDLFEQALELEPSLTAARASLALAYSKMGGLEPGERSWNPLAISTAQAAVRQDPHHPEAHRALAVAYHSTSRLKEAEDAYRRHLELAPGAPQTLSNLALIHERRGDLSGALDLLRRLHDRLGLAVGALEYSNLASILIQLGELDLAAEMLDAATAVNPHWSRAQANRIELELRRGAPERALDLARKALAERWDDWVLIEYGGRAALAAGAYEEAETWLARACADASGPIASACLGRAWLARRDGRPEQVETLLLPLEKRLRRSLSDGDEDHQTPLNLARLAALRGRRERTLQWLDLAIQQGFVDADQLSQEPYWNDIRDDGDFQARMDHLRGRLEAMRRASDAAQRFALARTS